MDLSRHRRAATWVAAARVGYGAFCMVAPRIALGRDGRDAAGSLVWMGRAFGVRDVALGVGTLWALQSGSDVDAARWVGVSAGSDATDIANAVAFRRELGVPGAIGLAATGGPAFVFGALAARALAKAAKA